MYNARAVELGRSRGHFLVDLCRPGHMTACLRTFQETIHCNDDNWDAHFGAPPDGLPSRHAAHRQRLIYVHSRAATGHDRRLLTLQGGRAGVLQHPNSLLRRHTS